jgi:hypothetical protein
MPSTAVGRTPITSLVNSTLVLDCMHRCMKEEGIHNITIASVFKYL